MFSLSSCNPYICIAVIFLIIGIIWFFVAHKSYDKPSICPNQEKNDMPDITPQVSSTKPIINIDDVINNQNISVNEGQGQINHPRIDDSFVNNNNTNISLHDITPCENDSIYVDEEDDYKQQMLLRNNINYNDATVTELYIDGSIGNIDGSIGNIEDHSMNNINNNEHIIDMNIGMCENDMLNIYNVDEIYHTVNSDFSDITEFQSMKGNDSVGVDVNHDNIDLLKKKHDKLSVKNNEQEYIELCLNEDVELLSSDNNEEIMMGDSDVGLVFKYKNGGVEFGDKNDKLKDKNNKLVSKDKNDELVFEDKNNELVSKDKNGELVFEDKNNELASKDKNDELVFEDKNNKLVSKDKNDALAFEDKNNELVSKDKNGELTSKKENCKLLPKDNNDETTSLDKNDEQIFKDENDEHVFQNIYAEQIFKNNKLSTKSSELRSKEKVDKWPANEVDNSLSENIDVHLVTDEYTIQALSTLPGDLNEVIVDNTPYIDTEFQKESRIHNKQIYSKKQHNRKVFAAGHKFPSRGEQICKRTMEKIYGVKFINVRLEWLKNPETGENLEIDCYNDELRIGVEYNGIQHYKWPNYTIQSYPEFIKQIRRDMLKEHLCRKNDVYLISVPYHVAFSKIPEYIVSYLPETIRERVRTSDILSKI